MARTRAQVKEAESLNPGLGSPSKTTRRKKELVINDVPASKYIQRILIGATTSLLTMGLLGWAVWTGRVILTGNFATDKMSGFGSKLEFTLRFLILPILWILVNDLLVMFARVLNLEALDPLNDREDLVEVPNNILRNSMEQVILTTVTQLSLISYLSAAEVARVIPFLNITFLIGRIAYYAGYPRFRTYGFTMTFLPTAAAIAFVAYKFFVTTFLS